jgi:hypothetical protein
LCSWGFGPLGWNGYKISPSAPRPKAASTSRRRRRRRWWWWWWELDSPVDGEALLGFELLTKVCVTMTTEVTAVEAKSFVLVVVCGWLAEGVYVEVEVVIGG